NDSDMHLFACTKTNLGPPAPTLAYRIRQEPGQPPAIDWLGEAPFAADDLVGRAAAVPLGPLNQAMEFLRDTIGLGGLPSETVYRVARASGISDRTLERAKKELGLVSALVMENNRQVWYWRYDEDANPKSLLQQLYVACADPSDETKSKI